MNRQITLVIEQLSHRYNNINMNESPSEASGSPILQVLIYTMADCAFMLTMAIV